MIARLLISGLAAMLLAPALAHAQDPYGTYTYVKGQRGTSPIPEENLKDNTVKIEEGKLSLLGADGSVQFEMRYVIDDDPGDGTYKATLEIVKSELLPEAVGARAKALAKGDGDTITLIYDFEAATHPTDFEPKGPSQNLFVLKKSAAPSN